MALSADAQMQEVIGRQNSLPVKAAAKVYSGAMVGDDGAGYNRGLVAGDPFKGHAQEQKDNTDGSDGDLNVLTKEGRYRLEVTLASVAVGDVGNDVYASDDATLTQTVGSNTYVGKIVRFVGTNTCVVEFRAGEGAGDVEDHEHTAGTDGGMLTSPHISTSIQDANGLTIILLTATGSAVNWVHIVNQSTGVSPSLESEGEADIGLDVLAKGTGTLQLGRATGSIQVGTVGTDLLGFYGTTPADQPAHVADPAASSAVTFTHSWNGATDPTAGEGAALITDLGALKTAIDANNAVIDSILAQLAELGLQAAS